MPENYLPADYVPGPSESPDDYLPRPEDFLPVAELANIPAKNTRQFLLGVSRYVREFRLFSLLDADRGHFKDAIRKVETASSGLLRALEYLDEYEDGSEMLDCFFHIELQSWNPKSGEYFPGWREVLFINGNWGRAIGQRGPLGDFKHRLEVLKGAAERVSTKRRSPGQSDGDPLRRGESRTKEFMGRIKWACEHYGGNLTYNKHYHTGTLAEVYDGFREMFPEFWTDLSRSTLQRLKSSKD